MDWLISNAGISTYDKFADYTFEEWNRIVNTNLSIPGVYDKRIYACDDRRRKRPFHGILCRTAGIFLICGIRGDKGSSTFPDEIAGQGI